MKIIKKYLINKLTVYTLSLFLLFLFCLFPTHENIKTDIVINDKTNKEVIYLLDKDYYVSRLITYFNTQNIEDEIKKKLDILINGSSEFDTFYPLIPKNTKINKVIVNKNNVYIDFSKEFLNVNKEIEELMIEAIIYSLCEINGIDNIYLSINNQELKVLPNTKKELPYPLNKNYGINKEYNLNSFNNINKTTVFFYKKHNDLSYLVPVTKINNSNESKLQIIINELKSSINSMNNLNGFYTNKIKLLDYLISKDKIELVFNDYMFEDINTFNNIETLISYSIFNNYDTNEIVIKNDIGSIYKIIKRET